MQNHLQLDNLLHHLLIIIYQTVIPLKYIHFSLHFIYYCNLFHNLLLAGYLVCFEEVNFI